MTTGVIRIAQSCGNFEDTLGVVNRLYTHLSNGTGTKFLPLGRIEREGMERGLQSNSDPLIVCPKMYVEVYSEILYRLTGNECYD